MKKWNLIAMLALLVMSLSSYAEHEGSGVGNGGPGQGDADVEKMKRELGHLDLRKAGHGTVQADDDSQDDAPVVKHKKPTHKKIIKLKKKKVTPAEDNNSDGSDVDTDQAASSEMSDLLHSPMYRRLPLPPRTSMDQVLGWCSRVTGMLGRELGRARVQLQYQRFGLVRQILVRALHVASESLDVDPSFGGPMTKTMVDRALVLNEALERSLPSSDRLTDTTKTQFLLKFVKQILDMERELDRPLYIPYRYRYGQCNPMDCPSDFPYPDFESIYVKYAKQQLEFVVDEFTMLDGNGRVVPIGSARAFLVMSELMSRFVAEDLAGNLYAYANACSVRDLMNLSDDLNAYNAFGDRSIFPNEPFAITGVRETLESVIENVSSGDCGGRY